MPHDGTGRAPGRGGHLRGRVPHEGDGCDEADSTTAALALAAGCDVLIAAAAVAMTRKSNRGAPIAATLGWVASYAPVVALFSAAVGYANSLPSGCGG